MKRLQKNWLGKFKRQKLYQEDESYFVIPIKILRKRNTFSEIQLPDSSLEFYLCYAVTEIHLRFQIRKQKDLLVMTKGTNILLLIVSTFLKTSDRSQMCSNYVCNVDMLQMGSAKVICKNIL